jgi:CxxC-x17-CxxC domain-containing protein
MMKTCAVSGKEFEVTEDDLEFYEKMGVPTPKLCPSERCRRKSVWRNEKKLYRRKCDFSQKDIIAMYAPKSPFKVYNQESWWSDKWNALDYGRDFDFSRPFFEQFRELQLEVPRISLMNKNSQNCQYTNHSANNKNCYLSTVIFDSEDIYYSNWVIDHGVNCIDCSLLFEGCQLCYEVYYAWGAYQAFFCEFIRRCRDVWFCYDCINCNNCFMCSNLRSKEFCIKNQQYSQEDYQKIMNDILPMSHTQLEKFKDIFAELKKSSIHRANYCLQTENSSGNLLFNTKNCKQCFDCAEGEDLGYCTDTISLKDVYDGYHMGWSQLVYDCHAIANSFDILFSHFSYDNKNIGYCDSVHNSNNLFGCVGINHKQYCILNKEYPKEEYLELRRKIIEHMKQTGEWGEFFPMEVAPFAYNESVAQDFFPLSKEEVLAFGHHWRDEDKKDYKPATTQVPETIADTPDSICEEILACEDCQRNYKIQTEELKFYKKNELPIPRKCLECRHTRRVVLRKNRTLHDRTCSNCSAKIQTTFAPDGPEKVYCEKCYLEAVN